MDFPVLVIGNQFADVEIVRSQLQPAFRNVYTAKNVEQGRRLLEQHGPRVLLMCFDPCTETRAHYTELLNSAKSHSGAGPQSIVLCDASEIRHAFGLALSGIVDDAAVYRPVHTPEQIQLRVWLALRRWEVQSRIEQLTTLFGGFQGGVRALGKLWRESVNGSLLLSERSKQDLSRFADRINTMVQALSASNESTGRPLPRGAVNTASDARIDHALAQFDQTLTTGLDTWRIDLERAYQTHVKPLEKSAGAGMRAITKILVVDDDHQVRQTLVTMLEFEGYAVSAVGDASSVLGLAVRLRPDLIMMDVNLAGESGLDVTRRLKAHPLLHDVPVLVISGLGFGDVVRHTRDAGADDFIVKPIKIDALRRKLAALLHQPQPAAISANSGL